MARLALGLALLLLVAVAVWAFWPMLPKPAVTVDQPHPSEGNAQWATYYHRLAAQAQSCGDGSKAAEFERMAKMYEWLDQESGNSK